MVACHIRRISIWYQIPVFTVASLFLRSYGELLNHVVDAHGLFFHPEEGSIPIRGGKKG